MTRTEASQLTRDVSKLSERQAVTETMLKALMERTIAQDEKLDRLLASHESLHRSQETLHRGQARADQDRAELAKQVTSMQPHVETVASWKTFWKIAAWIGATAGSVAATVWGLWVWLIQYVAWK